jgi:hypothetical protein
MLTKYAKKELRRSIGLGKPAYSAIVPAFALDVGTMKINPMNIIRTIREIFGM